MVVRCKNVNRKLIHTIHIKSNLKASVSTGNPQFSFKTMLLNFSWAIFQCKTQIKLIMRSCSIKMKNIYSCVSFYIDNKLTTKIYISFDVSKK